MPSSDDSAGCGSNSRYLQVFRLRLMIITPEDKTTHHISSKIALFKRWLTQNTLKYIDYELTRYSNETRIYEVMIRKSRENPLTLLRHRSLLTSGAFFSRWQNSICNFCSHFRYNIYVLITHMLNILSKIETYTRGLSPQNKQILPRSSPLRRIPFKVRAIRAKIIY